VTGFVNQVAVDISADIFTIGPSTTAAAQAAGLDVAAQAEYPSLEGLMEAMICAS
jgi:uroporphyrinogen-III synthase